MPDIYSLKNKKIWVAGHNGLVGSALCRRLESENCQVLTVSKAELDCRDQQAVQSWMLAHKPDAVIIAAAKVGGIQANIDAPAEFLFDNLMIEANIIHGAYETGAEKLLFLGSSCIYPKNAKNPISEDALLKGDLEPSNEAYAIAKIAGIKLCQSYRYQYGCDFISAMPCNLYGPNDNFDHQASHVIPALIARMHQAKINDDKSFEVWGSGKPLREFLYVDDLADALVLLMKDYSAAEPINIGSDEEVSIRDLAEKIANIVGFQGELEFNMQKPDGVAKKCLNSERIRRMGWSQSRVLSCGLEKTYKSFLDNC